MLILKTNKMNDLNMDMFAFLTWLERNREAHTANGLTIEDGYEWYNRQWKCWLKNSDAGKQILNHIGEVTWWGGNPGMNNDVKTTGEKTTADENKTGETTITFPKPEQYNPNRAQLDTMTFKFYQEENCVDGGMEEHFMCCELNNGHLVILMSWLRC